MKSICFFGGYVADYPRSDVLRKGLQKRGITVRACRTTPRKRLLTRYATLAVKYMRLKKDFDVIYVPEFRHKDVPLAFLLARLTGKRVVFDPLVSRYDTKIKDRGDAKDGSFQSWHNRNLDRMSLALTDMVLADTQAHADYYVEQFGVPRHKVRVLPVGFDEGLFTSNGFPKTAGNPTDRLNVLFFGNYLPLHGVDVIVSAAQLLQEKRIDFTIIGRGQTFDGVDTFVTREHLSNVKLLARVPMGELAGFINRSDLCLGIFGQTEKTGRVVANKVYQSMAMGKPVITADSAAVREFFADDDTICLVSPDARSLANKIEELGDNPARRSDIGRRGSELVRREYSSSAIASLFLDHCASVFQ